VALRVLAFGFVASLAGSTAAAATAATADHISFDEAGAGAGARAADGPILVVIIFIPRLLRPRLARGAMAIIMPSVGKAVVALTTSSSTTTATAAATAAAAATTTTTATIRGHRLQSQPQQLDVGEGCQAGEVGQAVEGGL
jgi:hypothetical protein